MLIGVTTVGKARGATTVATGLAAALGDGGQASLLIEADTAGGDLASLRGLDVDAAGVLGFAAAAGSDTDQAEAAILEQVWTHPASPSCAIMPLAAGGPGVEAQVEAMWNDGQTVLSRWPGPVVFDLGRFSPGICARIWSGCDLGVVVASGSLAGLRRAEAGWAEPPLRNDMATWRVINGSPWPLATIETETGLIFDNELSWDPRGAEQIRSGNWKSARRRHLARELALLGAELSWAEIRR